MKTAEDYGMDPAHVVIGGDSAGGNLAATACQALAHRRDISKLRAQGLIYPGLQGLDLNLPSYQQNQSVPFLFQETVAMLGLRGFGYSMSFKDCLLEGPHVPMDMKLKYRKWIHADNIPKEFKVRGHTPKSPSSFSLESYGITRTLLSPAFSPLTADEGTICLLPKPCIITCEYDVFRDDGLLYKKRLEDNGIKVTWYHIENGSTEVYGFFGYRLFSFPSGEKVLNHTIHFIKDL